MLQVPLGSLISSPAAHEEPPKAADGPSKGGEAVGDRPAEGLGDRRNHRVQQLGAGHLDRIAVAETGLGRCCDPVPVRSMRSKGQIMCAQLA